MSFINKLFGTNRNLSEYVAKGAQVIDVRSPKEFEGGHVEGSLNIPLDQIAGKKAEIKKLNKPVILCCASGMRSGQASRTLSAAGIDCINGGGWTSVNKAVASVNSTDAYKLL